MLSFAPYFGYLASLFLIIALVVANDLKFRWFNTAGNVAFIIYAIILNAFPVLLTNGILLFINVYYLYRIYNRKEDFKLITFTGNEQLATNFLQFYREDIASYFPDYPSTPVTGNLNFVVLRDMVIANMFSATLTQDGNAVVALNYTLKKYRDFKVGRFIFEKEKTFLQSRGVQKIVYESVANKSHLQFLKVMGFSKTATGHWEKNI
jgi:hypothetical protein